MSSQTQRDLQVLDMVFDPEGSLSSGPLECSDDSEPTEKDREAIQLELQAIQKAESGQMTEALKLLNHAVDISPTWPSSYNNRAQLKRMTKQPTSEILEDLGHAIRLASPNPTHSVLTRRNAKTLAQAYTQRSAVFYTLLDPNLSESHLNAQLAQIKKFKPRLTSQPNAQSLETVRIAIEEIASQDLNLGARYGNTIAKQVAVQTNPYAKLCGKMVREALISEYSNHD